jgi:hypothetical protein
MFFYLCFLKKKKKPENSRGRDQEDHGSKPARANSLWDPILKTPTENKGLVERLKV